MCSPMFGEIFIQPNITTPTPPISSQGEYIMNSLLTCYKINTIITSLSKTLETKITTVTLK